MAIQSFTVDPGVGEAFTIFGEAANINYFIKGDLDPDEIDGATNVQVAADGGTRRQYPGDLTPINFAASTREVLKDPSRKSGNALPGKPFVLYERKEDGTGEKRQFTLKGRVLDLHAFLSAEAAFDLYLFTNTGARYSIPEAVVTP